MVNMNLVQEDLATNDDDFSPKGLFQDDDQETSEEEPDIEKLLLVEPINLVPLELEDGDKAINDDLSTINLETEKDPCPTFVSDRLLDEERAKYIKFLKENKDVLA